MRYKLFILVSVFLLTVLFSTVSFAQNDDNNNNDDNDSLFDNDQQNNNDDDIDVNNDGLDIEVPQASIKTGIRVGLGTDLILKNEEAVENIYGPDSGIPLQEFYKPSAFGRFFINITYLGFNLCADAEILSTISSDNSELFKFYLNELYTGYMSSVFGIKIGQFMVEWSNADLLKINNFFSSPIIPELRPYSEFNQYGTKGVWLQFFINKANITFDLLFVPTPTFDSIPDELMSPLYGMQSDYIQVIINNNSPKFDMINAELGLRFGITFSGIDFYLSYFNGYYKNSFIYTLEMIPSTNPPAEPSQIIFTRIYERINAIGLNVAFGIANRFSVRLEYNTIFGIPLIYNEGLDLGAMGTFINKKLQKETSFNYTIGIDFEAFSDFRILVEYSDIWFTGNIESIDYTMYPTSKNILLTLKYTFYEDRFSPFILSAYNYALRVLSISTGIEIDFINGFKLDFLVLYMKEFDPEYIDNTYNGSLNVLDSSFTIKFNAYYQF